MTPEIKKILEGDHRTAARLISLIEDRDPAGIEMLKALYPHAGKAFLIGVTGPAGAGKSTLVARMIGRLRHRVIVVDEIDKASGDSQYDPLGSLYTLLEHDTACDFIDEFAEVPIDASEVVWIATANDSRSIPEPILNRMNVYAIDPPDTEGSRRIAQSIYDELRAEHAWGRAFPPQLGGESLDRLARLKPREMRRVMLAAFGNAKLDGRSEVRPDDVVEDRFAKKARIGF